MDVTRIRGQGGLGTPPPGSERINAFSEAETFLQLHLLLYGSFSVSAVSGTSSAFGFLHVHISSLKESMGLRFITAYMFG